jgi:hypothetical protein
MSKLAKVLQAAAGNTPAGDLAAAIDFDGTNDYLSRSSDMTGNADGKTFTVSAWVYRTVKTTQFIYQASTDRFDFYMTANGLEFYAINPAGTAVLDANVTLTPTIPLYTWCHILVSIDLANTSNRYWYINDINVTSSATWNTYTNDNIDFTRTAHSVGGSTSGSGKLTGRLSNVFLDYTYRDLSVTNNRRLFITEDGKPANGQAGLNPIMYMPLDDPEDIGNNAGTGGNFTVNGVMARSGRGPNQYNAAASSMFTGGQNVTLATVGLTTTGYTISVNVKTQLTTQIIPFWVEANSTNTQAQLTILNTGVLRFNAYNYATSTTLIRFTADASLVANRFYNIQAVIDTVTSANNKFYVDGVAVAITMVTFVSTANHTLSYNAQVYGDGGTFSDVYFTNGKIDLSTDNPFYDTDTNKPKYLGESGELPTGSSPLVYLPLRGNDAGNNLGTGGDFTVNSGPFTGARGPSEFLARSAKFNGTDTHLSRTDNVGFASSKMITVVLALKKVNTTNKYLFAFFANGPTYETFEFKDVGGDIGITIKKGDGAAVLSGQTDSSFVTANNWHILLFSVDTTSTSKRHFYLDGAIPSTVNWRTYANTAAQLNNMSIADIGADEGGDLYSGDLSNLYIVQDYIDFSQEANRLKFVDGLGYPRDLTQQIEDGDIPTPLVYMKFDDTSALGTNSGTGGDFTINGTVTSGADVSV